MRIVLDTNILARAASGPPSPAAEVLQLSLASPHILCVSPFLISELSRVLRYERVRRIHGMSDQVIDQFLQDLQTASLMVEPDPDESAGGQRSLSQSSYRRHTKPTGRIPARGTCKSLQYSGSGYTTGCHENSTGSRGKSSRT